MHGFHESIEEWESIKEGIKEWKPILKLFFNLSFNWYVVVNVVFSVFVSSYIVLNLNKMFYTVLCLVCLRFRSKKYKSDQILGGFGLGNLFDLIHRLLTLHFPSPSLSFL